MSAYKPPRYIIVVHLLMAMLTMTAIAKEPTELPPIAKAMFHGKMAVVEYQNLVVTIDKSTSNDPKQCPGGLDAQTASCRVLVVKGEYNKHAAFSMVGVGDAEFAESGEYAPAITLRRLDPSATAPQVVFSFHTDGAHCCANFQIATIDPANDWHVINGGSRDGDNGYIFLDLDHDGSTEIVGIDDDFLYAFSGYAGSYAPTSILKLHGLKIDNVTRSPIYRSYLMQQLREMEDSASKYNARYSNGYLAGWVAQKSLLGQTNDAWRVMIKSYDHSEDIMSGAVGNAMMACHVAERVWEDADKPYAHCPTKEEYIIPFPEALALHLVKYGYLSLEQSKRLGYDVAQIEAERTKEMEAGAIRFEAQRTNAWWAINRYNTCILSQAPASPAEIISFDRANGLTDSVRIEKSDESGKPLVVSVAEPQGNGMETVYMFYRGQVECETQLRRQQQGLEDLK